MSKYVAEGELLQELYRAYILQEGIDEPFYVPLEEFKPELITPLTPAQERAGDKEKYAVIDRGKLNWILSDADTGQPNTDICPYAAHSQPRKCKTGEPNCLKCRLGWLTAEQEGE
jgi:hypothetical protein